MNQGLGRVPGAVPLYQPLVPTEVAAQSSEFRIQVLAALIVLQRYGIELEPVVDQLVAELAGDLGLQPFDFLGLEFDHLACAQVDEVVVMRVGNLLEARASLAEIVPLDNAGILEQLDSAVDGGDRNAVVDFEQRR